MNTDELIEQLRNALERNSCSYVYVPVPCVPALSLTKRDYIYERRICRLHPHRDGFFVQVEVRSRPQTDGTHLFLDVSFCHGDYSSWSTLYEVKIPLQKKETDDILLGKEVATIFTHEGHEYHVYFC